MLDTKYRFYVLYFPNLKKYLIPSVITSVGLAWKSEIAAEIIAYTRNSIGQLINDGKYNLDTPVVFAWTFIVIFFSILFESLIKSLLRRIEK
jgi:NitT/TauT family transport system permease protein